MSILHSFVREFSSGLKHCCTKHVVTFPFEPLNSFTVVLKWNLTPFSSCIWSKNKKSVYLCKTGWLNRFPGNSAELTFVKRAPMAAPKTLANGVGDWPTTSTLDASPLLIPNAATSNPVKYQIKLTSKSRKVQDEYWRILTEEYVYRLTYPTTYQ